jgi:hypothetical protein
MKAQVSTEFLLGVGILFIVYVVSLTGFSTFAQAQLLENEEARQACYTVSASIDSTTVGGHGFSMNVTLPYRFDIEQNFLIIVFNQSNIDVVWPGGFFSCSMITQNVTQITMFAGKFSLNNINNTVYVSSVSTDKLRYDLGEDVTINGTYYFNDVNLDIERDGVPVASYPQVVSTTNNSFSHLFAPTSTGHYKITVRDTGLETFYSEREFDVA